MCLCSKCNIFHNDVGVGASGEECYLFVLVLLFLECFCFRLEWNKIQWDGIGEDGATALADVLRVTKDFTILKYASNFWAT